MENIMHEGLSIDFYTPENKIAKGSIIMIPGGSGKNYIKSEKIFTGYNDLAERFCNAGFQVYLFDAKGQGKSDKGAGYSCPNAVEDLSTVVTYIKSSPKTKNNNIGIWGRCGGAIIAVKYAITFPDTIKSLAFWGCPTNMSQFFIEGTDKYKELVKEMSKKNVCIDENSFHEIWDFENMAGKINIPFFFAVGTEDSLFERNKITGFLETFPKKVLSAFVQLPCFGHEVDKSHPFFDYYSELYINWFNTTLK